MIRANSTLRRILNDSGIRFLDHAANAVQRILPHVEVSWTEEPWEASESVWTSSKRTEIRIIISVGNKADADAKCLKAYVRRRNL